MIDVHGAKCNTPCNGLRYPCLLNNIWRTFLNSKSSSIQSQSPTIPSYYIKPNKNSKEIYLTYGPALGWTQPDNGADAPYNFAVPAEIEESAVMFIGMNPSYIPSNSDREYDDYWTNKQVIKAPLTKEDQITGWQFEEFYDPNSVFFKSSYFDDLRELIVAFYKKKKMSEDLIKYAHLDLLAIRHTAQGDLEDALKMYYNTNNKNYNQSFVNFINSQIDVFKELLRKAKPKVIIVNSGLASNILRNKYFFFQKDTLSIANNTDIWKDLRIYLNMKLSWDDNISTYRWINPTYQIDGEMEEKNIPVFLCGMTSGQRALDSGRREDLITHVAKVI